MKYNFDWVDAFTDTPFGGNGCAVFHDAGEMPLAQRMALVRETSLSECAYMVPSDKADFGARYYLADCEILMAGHPTIATVRSLLHRGMIPLRNGCATITLEVGAGVLPIEIIGGDDPVITMTQAAPEFGAYCDPSEIAEIYGLNAVDIVGKPRIVSTGTAFCIAVIKSTEALKRAVMDAALYAKWQARHQSDATGAMPFLVTLEGATKTGDTYSRMLMAPPHPAEDPFTGSATGCMAAYLWAEGLLKTPDFIAEQGHGMGRPGRANVSVLGPRDNISGVKVGGKGVVVMEGQFLAPPIS